MYIVDFGIGKSIVEIQGIAGYFLTEEFIGESTELIIRCKEGLRDKGGHGTKGKDAKE